MVDFQSMLEILRKFGLRYHDLPTMLWNAEVLLRVLALDIDSRNVKRLPIIIYLTAAIILLTYFYAYPVSTYWFIFWRGNDDILFNIVLFSLTVSSFIGVVKLLYMYFNGVNVQKKYIQNSGAHSNEDDVALPAFYPTTTNNWATSWSNDIESLAKELEHCWQCSQASGKLKKLVSEYLSCDAALVPGSRMSRNVNATLRNVKRRAIIFWLLIIGDGVIYAGSPLLKPGRHLFEDEQALLGLEPVYESPNYELAKLALYVGVFLTVYAPANITGFIIIIVGYSEAQMIALSKEVLHIWEDAQIYYKQNHSRPDDIPNCSSSNDASIGLAIRKKKNIKINEYVKHRLVNIMKSHATNINLIKQIESIFKSAIAIEFALLSIGLIADLLGGLENTYMEVLFAFVHVAMDCFTGQRLIDANKAFEHAIYECKWERFDASNRKLVLVMLQNAQKTMQLSAGGLASLSYISLMAVIKSIYSAYTALLSTMNKHA